VNQEASGKIFSRETIFGAGWSERRCFFIGKRPVSPARSPDLQGSRAHQQWSNARP
jgi:hypothetical protein